MGLIPEHVMEPEVVFDFLSTTLPFSELAPSTRTSLARQCVVDFAPKGAMLLSRGVTQVSHLAMIQKGGVKLFIRDETGGETLLDYRGEGDTLGGLAILRGGLATMDAETLEDTFLFLMPAATFMDLFEKNPFIAQHFVRDFSDNYIAKAFNELRAKKTHAVTEGGLYLFSAAVGDLVGRPAVTIPMGMTIQDAAMRMYKETVGSLLVTDPSGEVLGIVTDKDLRKAVALGMDYGATIETIMSTPVKTMDAHEVCFDALYMMMADNIHHLAVERAGKITGMVTSHDIMVMQGKSPLTLFREIKTQRSIEGLYPLAAKAPQVVRTLLEEGAKSGHITRMIAIINDLILEKIMEILIARLGPPPVPFCWLLMGSEGRREQTFSTDQDNAIVYKTTNDEIIDRANEIYFSALAERAVDHLEKCGFARCGGEVMATNIKWRQHYDLWRDQFENWISIPEPEEVLNSTIFFDFRCGYGDRTLAEALRAHVTNHARHADRFLRFLAADTCKSRPPLSFFKNFIVEKDGEHKNTLDLKHRGVVPFTDFARTLALKHGIKETNTLARLDALREGDHLSPELYQDAREAYEFILQLRLVHQLGLVEEGREPNNRLDPATLSELEKRTLKEAFSVIGRIQQHLKDLYHLELG